MNTSYLVGEVSEVLFEEVKPQYDHRIKKEFITEDGEEHSKYQGQHVQRSLWWEGAWFVQDTVRRSMYGRDKDQRTARDNVFRLFTKTLSKMGKS